MTKEKMTLIYEGLDGSTFAGKDAKGIVLQMSRRDFLAKGKTEYMGEVKKRLSYFGTHIKYSDYESFLDALVKAKIIKRIYDN